MNETFRIVRLEAENIKRLRSVVITPAGDVVTLTGDNGAGKSSVLDAIELALAGKRAQPPAVIHQGEESARVVLDLGKLVVERKWTSNEKSYLEVRSPEGAAYKSPQALLDDLWNEISFDPLRFVRMEAKEQAELVRQLAGVHFGELDAQRAAAVERRTEIGREGVALKGRLAQLVVPAETPDEPVSVDALLEEHKRLTAAKETNDRLRSDATRARDQVKVSERNVELAASNLRDIEAALAAAKEKHQRALDLLGEARELADDFLKKTSMLVDPDTSEVYRQIKGAEATNDLVKRKKERAQVEAAIAERTKAWKTLDAAIAAIDEAKAKVIAESRLPVPGLSFSDAGVLMNGLPFEQASQAEKLRISLAMGIALNPKLRVMLIRDASLLDKKSMELVAQMARDAGVQVWLERVAAPGEVGIRIEDGHVAGQLPPPAKTNGKAKEKSHA